MGLVYRCHDHGVIGSVEAVDLAEPVEDDLPDSCPICGAPIFFAPNGPLPVPR
jgi:hypothetical protein